MSARTLRPESPALSWETSARIAWLGALVVFASGCDSPGRDEQDAMDDTISVVDAVIDVSQDTALHDDVNADAPVKIDNLAGGETVPLTQLAEAIAQWECQRIVACGCTTPKQAKPDVVDCVAQLTPAIAKTWSNGGLVARAALIPVCVAALEADSAPCAVAKLTSVTPCLAALRWPGKTGDGCGGNGPFLCADGGLCEGGKCTGNHLGVVAEGQACSTPFVCGDAECSKNSAGKGTCKSPVTIGKACADSGDCAMPAFCSEGVCALPGKVGGACTSVLACSPGLACEGGVCATPTACTPGKSCGNGGECLGEVHNNCASKHAIGDGCKSDGECVDTAFCEKASKKCVARPVLGAPCGNGVWCAAGLGCETGKTTCEALPKASQKCLLGAGGPFLCAPGFACKADTFTCDMPPVAGQPCAADNTCSDADIDGDGKMGDLACNVTAKGNVCAAKLTSGAPCQNDACQDGLFCDAASGKCVKTYTTGVSCKSATECGAGGSCIPNAGGKLSCGPLPKGAESCLTDCASGLFCAIGAQNTSCQPPICGDLYAL